jgi:hypothetical protein
LPIEEKDIWVAIGLSCSLNAAQFIALVLSSTDYSQEVQPSMSMRPTGINPSQPVTMMLQLSALVPKGTTIALPPKLLKNSALEEGKCLRIFMCLPLVVKPCE